MDIKDKKILIVEDNAVLRNEIAEILNMEDAIIIEACNGKEGIEKSKQVLPDIIISDILMPELDGITLIKELKKNSLTRNIPFVFLTALSDTEYVNKGVNLGADNYLKKPINVDNLIIAIKIGLNKNKITEQKMNNLRSSILMSLPHELRTPLNGVLGFSYIMMNDKGELNKERTTKYAKFINYSAKRLLKSIEKYLTLTELQLLQTNSTKIKLARQKFFNCSGLSIREIANNLTTKYNYTRNIEIDISQSKINIDENHFKLIIEELVSNAIKFSNNKKVVIKGVNKHNKFYLVIKNEGNGISESQIADIGSFTQFNRKKQEQQGVGLGLTIVNAISEIYNIKIDIDSEQNKYFVINLCFNVF